MRSKGDIAALVILIVLAVILIPILAINLTLIIKGSVNEDVPPSVFGIAPMAVTTGSMDGDREDSFAEGSLIFVRILDDEGRQELKEGDIVTFRTKGTFVTHRIVDVTTSDGKTVSVTTQGDANNVGDGATPIENVVGVCTGSIGGLGAFSIFMQTPVGIVVVIGVPVAAYIVYDIVRVTLARKKAKAGDTSPDETDKDEEIRRLRALLEEKNGAAASPSEAEDVAAVPAAEDVSPAETTDVPAQTEDPSEENGGK